jgi:thiamine biosynthesis lipoprotein
MKRLEKVFTALGTVNDISVTIPESETENAGCALHEIRNYVNDMDDRLSVFKPGSLVSRINQNAGEEPISVDEDTFRLLQLSQKYAFLTKGAFDITVRRQTEAWRGARDGHPVPVSKPAGCQHLVLDEGNHSAFLTDAGEGIDLGGIAKGYAVSHALEILRQANIKEAVLNFGGSTAILGPAQPIGIRNPFLPVNRNASSESIGEVFCRDEIIITSGIYEQYFSDQGTIRHHIIDPKTGVSSQSDLISATLIGKNGALLDALATACIVVGMEKSIELCQENQIEAVFILHNGSLFATNGLQNRFRIRKESLL